MTFAFSETVTDMPSLSPAANAICKTVNYSRQSPSPSTIPTDFIVGLRRAPQSRQVRAAAERVAQIGGERADISPFAADDVERRDGIRPFDERKRLHFDVARCARNLDPLARVVVIASPLKLERGVRRRRL